MHSAWLGAERSRRDRKGTEPVGCRLLRIQWKKHTVNFAIITCYPAPRCSVRMGLWVGERQLLELGRCRQAEAACMWGLWAAGRG